jgi:hypothetical protein
MHFVLIRLLSLSLSLSEFQCLFFQLFDILQLVLRAGHLLYQSNASLILTSTALGAEKKLWCTGNGWNK